MDVVLRILNLLGALGVFLFGMKMLSEGLQKVAGTRLKKMVGRITSNRVKGVLTGFVVTSVIQSSSATTVMLVGFVNAKLLSLRQAIGVIMGANIGTTVTGWLVALLGFKVKISAFALPAVAVGFLMTFLHGANRKQAGEALIGFGLLFLGLAMMKDAVPGIEESQFAWMESLTGAGILSTLLFVAVGTGLTVALQSSSATMTLTLALTASGFIPYEAAAAMVLGENIGTTATANIASIGTTTVAKQAARAHLLFNLFGVVWSLTLFHWVLLPVVDALVPGDPNAMPGGIEVGTIVTAHLAAFHTLFNVTNTLVLLPFVEQIAALAERLTKHNEPVARQVTRYLSVGVVETPELLLVQVGQEMQHLSDIVHGMYGNALRILTQPDEDFTTLIEETLACEEQVDAIEREVTSVLAMIARAATSASAAREVGAMVLNTHHLERMADHCEKLVRIAVRDRAAQSGRMDAEAVNNIAALGALVDTSLDNLRSYLLGQSTLADAERIETAIDAARSETRRRYLARMQGDDVDVIPGMWLLDVLSHLEEIGDQAFDIIRRAEATKQL